MTTTEKRAARKIFGITICSYTETKDEINLYWLGGLFRKRLSSDAVRIYFFGIRIYWAHIVSIDLTNSEVVEKQSQLCQICALAAKVHGEVFPKYRRCNKGKDIVLMASGPSLDHYTALPDALHLGVNYSFLSGKAKLDYHFCQDNVERCYAQVREFSKDGCEYFMGYHNSAMICIPNCAVDSFHAKRYVFYDPRAYGAYWLIAPNIECMPLSCRSTVALPAAQFALWTEPHRLFLVGCDCSNDGHAAQIGGATEINVPSVIQEWYDLAENARILYPNTEIISINPVGLRGVFKDVYTQSFLEANPQTVQQIKQLSSQEPVLLDDIL